jgi:ATP-dependent DNA helicase RecQ
MASAEQIRELARSVLGIEELRPGQLEAVEAVGGGRDTLAVMATGYGKSAIYQLAGELVEGPTIVVSPLIALQRDQVEAMEAKLPPGEAAELNSTISANQRRALFERLRQGEREFVLLAPEQLAKEEVMSELRAAKPGLLVIDEAHCISEWGHDFRPEYLRLGAFAERLGEPTLLALTATASPPVRREIVERLRMRDPALIVRGFDRPNLHFAVRRFSHGPTKDRELHAAVVAAAKPGIVYIATRHGAEALAEELRAAGVGAEAYHAGLPAHRRDQLQDAFMDDEVEVVVATTAFGMGIDKPNVRFVFHAGVSDSVDSYYQEVGRAGRDGEPAAACVFYRPEDEAIRRFFGGGGGVEAVELEAVARAVEAHGDAVDPPELSAALHFSGSRVLEAVNRLEGAGWLVVRDDGEVERRGDAPPLADAIAAGAAASERHREFERSRLEMMRAYAETDGCRRDFVLSYFGEEHEVPCWNCDNCDAGLVQADSRPRPFAIGDLVRHPEWGQGEVQRYDRDHVVVLFEAVGYKTLGLDLVAAHELLQPA